MPPIIQNFAIVALCVSVLLPITGYAGGEKGRQIAKVVAQSVEPVMQKYRIPGMAVGIVVKGQSYIYYYGVASKATGRSVTSTTLVEIGSVSKTFTATLASYAQLKGKLSLSDSASRYLPSLRGSSLDKVNLLNLGTHTPGGMPLQVPDNIKNNQELMDYFRSWKPAYAPGTYPAVLASEAYGIKTTAADLLRFVKANPASPAYRPKLAEGSNPDAYRLFSDQHDDAGFGLGAVSLSSRTAGAACRQLGQDELRSQPRNCTRSFFGTAGSSVLKQNRIDKWLRCLCGIRYGREHRRRVAGQ
jgi:hypothetical protein